MLTELRFARFWLVFGWVSVVLAMYVSLMPVQSVSAPAWNDKLLHGLGYFLLTFWFCGIYPRSHYWKIGLAMLGMGLLVEVLQGAMQLGRHAELMDLVADIAGIVPAVLLALTPVGRWPRWIETLLVRA